GRGPRLRGERRDEPMPVGDAANRLADVELLVGGHERRRMRGRELLLAVSELRVVLLDRNRLTLEGLDELVDVVLRRHHADRREAERRVDRRVAAVDRGREGELVLEPDLQLSAALLEPR